MRVLPLVKLRLNLPGVRVPCRRLEEHLAVDIDCDRVVVLQLQRVRIVILFLDLPLRIDAGPLRQ